MEFYSINLIIIIIIISRPCKVLDMNSKIFDADFPKWAKIIFHVFFSTLLMNSHFRNCTPLQQCCPAKDRLDLHWIFSVRGRWELGSRCHGFCWPAKPRHHVAGHGNHNGTGSGEARSGRTVEACQFILGLIEMSSLNDYRRGTVAK